MLQLIEELKNENGLILVDEVENVRKIEIKVMGEKLKVKEHRKSADSVVARK